MGLKATLLERALATLIDKRVVVRATSLSTATSPGTTSLTRTCGSGCRSSALACRRSGGGQCGRAIEPVLREGIERMGAAGPAGSTGVVGGYWTLATTRRLIWCSLTDDRSRGR